MRRAFALQVFWVVTIVVFARGKEFNNQELYLLDDGVTIEFLAPGSSQSNAAYRPAFPYFSQLDPRWSDERMGKSYLQIGPSGGEFFSLTMLLGGYNFTVGGESVNPSNLNEYLLQADGWLIHGNIRWPALWDIGFKDVGPFKAFDDVIRNLAAGNYCILAIDLHNVLAVGFSGDNYHVMDPRDQSKTTYHKKEIKEARCFVKKQ